MKQISVKTNISVQADESLERILGVVNSDFEAGKIGRLELASWIVLHFEKHNLQNEIEALRSDHFDNLTYLESIVGRLKKARKDGDRVTNLDTLLSPLIDKNARQKQ